MSDELSEMMFEAVENELADNVEELEIVAEDEGVDSPEEIEADLDGTDSDDTDEDAEDFEDADTDDDPPVADEDDAFDWNEILDRYGDRPVPLKVNGEIVERPLREAFDGAMMREDYSRKTADVSRLTQAAQWAQDVQESLAKDPEGTLRAFAEAYRVDSLEALQQVDPYEDMDPDVAAVLRRLDEAENRHQAELAELNNRTLNFEHQKMVEEVKHEVSSLANTYEDFDEGAVLQTAIQFNLSLAEAAELWDDRRLAASARQNAVTGASASQAAKVAAEANRKAKKKRAAGTTIKGYDASDTSIEDFDTISELFEIEMNSTS
jgi:hypothetical protein